MINPCETEVADEVIKQFQWLLALIRAQYLMYQECHWTTSGPEYYGNHLLFQRLYESVQDEADGFAEKMIGLCAKGSVDPSAVMRKTLYWHERWMSKEDLHERGWASELDFQKVIHDLYEVLDKNDLKTMGLDDMMMAMSSNHETHQYLLRQVLGR